MNASAAPIQRINRKDPQWAALAREIRLGSFVYEGHFAAFPLCFPGVTLPIPREESRIVALTTDADGLVYGTTTGRANHVIFACFQGPSGVVLDLKWPDPGAFCPAICCGAKETLFAANPAAGGGRLLRRPLQGRPGDLLHEWSFQNHPFVEVPAAVFAEPILDLVATRDRRHAVGATRTEIFVYDFEAQSLVTRKPLPAAGRLCPIGDAVYGLDGDGAVWRFRPTTGALDLGVARGPGGLGDPVAARWAADRDGRFVYLIVGDGRLFRFTPEGGLVEAARFGVTPVTAAAVTPDGRLFSFAGEGIAHFHIFEPSAGKLRELGAAVSILERRRYGYAFAAATPGFGGEILFGDNDDLGHLWLYFPTILSAPPA